MKHKTTAKLKNIIIAATAVILLNSSVGTSSVQAESPNKAQEKSCCAKDENTKMEAMMNKMMKEMMGKMMNSESEKGEGAMMCPMCKTMMSDKGDKGDMMDKCKGMMGKMGMSDEMVKRMDAMMKTPIFLDSPCAIFGQGDRLKLSDKQTKRLVEIENEARKKALATLTPEQRNELGELPDTPMPMIKMCQQMRKEMMGAMSEDAECKIPNGKRDMPNKKTEKKGSTPQKSKTK